MKNRLIKVKFPKASKNYICDECKQPINKGSLYRKLVFVSLDNKFFNKFYHTDTDILNICYKNNTKLKRFISRIIRLFY